MKNMYNPKQHSAASMMMMMRMRMMCYISRQQYIVGKCYINRSTWRWGEQGGPLLVGESVAEVAPVAVGTGVAGKDHPAKLGLVAWVPDDRTQLSDAVSELAVMTVWTRAGLLPLVAQLCLHHPLIVYLQLQCLFILLSLPACHVHPLLLLLLLLHPPSTHKLSKI